MDVDVPAIESGEDLISFFAIQPRDFAWQNDIVEGIKKRRAAMDGQLFFDILLELGGVKDTSSLYPPTDRATLERLLKAVESASYDSMKRDCLMYYLLRWHMDGREMGFLEDKVISPHYVALADAYWHLDTGTSLNRAVSLLSDARIVKDYTSKIIQTLSLSSLASSILIRKFVRTCKPPMREAVDMERYMIATAGHSVVDAWQYQRTLPDNFPARKNLIHKLLSWTLTPKPKQQPLVQLLSVSFSKYEESVVQEFARHPPDNLPLPSTSLVRDMVCVRLIQSCKYAEAVKFDRAYPSSGGSGKGTWGAERSRIISDVLSVMPPAERALLEAELDGLSIGASSSYSSSISGGSWTNLNASGTTDMSMSWEDIGRRANATPRQSMGKRGPATGRSLAPKTPRQSLSNGFAAKQNLFTPGASTSTQPRATPPLSAHPTLISQGTAPSSGTPSLSFSASLFSSATTHSTPPRMPTQRLSGVAPAPPKIVVNGSNGVNGSGTLKTNAFITRNAFFDPPEFDERDMVEANGFDVQKSPAKTVSKSPQRQPKIRLPTPPQDEPEDEPIRTTVSQPQDDQDGAADVSQSADGDDHSVASEREDLSFSMFGARNGRLTPPTTTSSPRRSRKNRAESSQRIVPGAFVSDEETTHNLFSPKRATQSTQEPHTSASTSAKQSAASTTRNSRKRAISPETSADNIKLSIPGTLYEDDEDEVSHDFSREEADEKVDELLPLPSESHGRSRRKAAGSSVSAAGPSKRRSSRSSRASTVDPEESDSGRIVRRSSRLSNTSNPATESKKSERPRKSTRTTGAGATATGKGASKRR